MAKMPENKHYIFSFLKFPPCHFKPCTQVAISTLPRDATPKYFEFFYDLGIPDSGRRIFLMAAANTSGVNFINVLLAHFLYKHLFSA